MGETIVAPGNFEVPLGWETPPYPYAVETFIKPIPYFTFRFLLLFFGLRSRVSVVHTCCHFTGERTTFSLAHILSNGLGYSEVYKKSCERLLSARERLLRCTMLRSD